MALPRESCTTRPPGDDSGFSGPPPPGRSPGFVWFGSVMILISLSSNGSTFPLVPITAQTAPPQTGHAGTVGTVTQALAAAAPCRTTTSRVDTRRTQLRVTPPRAHPVAPGHPFNARMVLVTGSLHDRSSLAWPHAAGRRGRVRCVSRAARDPGLPLGAGESGGRRVPARRRRRHALPG